MQLNNFCFSVLIAASLISLSLSDEGITGESTKGTRRRRRNSRINGKTNGLQRWETNINALKDHIRNEGSADVPVDYEAADAPHLGRWLFRMRQMLAKNDSIQPSLSQEKKNKLLSLGVKPSTSTHTQVPKMGRTTSTMTPPVFEHSVHRGNKSSSKVLNHTHHQVRGANITNSSFSGSQQALWNEVYKRGVRAIFKYKLQHNSTDVPRSFVDESGLKVGAWLSKIQRAHAQGRTAFGLSDDQKTSLEALLGKTLEAAKGSSSPRSSDSRASQSSFHRGVKSNASALVRPLGAQARQFHKYINALRRYREREGTVKVPRGYIETETAQMDTRDASVGKSRPRQGDLRLGGWLKQVVARAQRGDLPEVWRQQLEDMGVQGVVGFKGTTEMSKLKHESSKQGGSAGARRYRGSSNMAHSVPLFGGKPMEQQQNLPIRRRYNKDPDQNVKTVKRIGATPVEHPQKQVQNQNGRRRRHYIEVPEEVLPKTAGGSDTRRIIPPKPEQARRRHNYQLSEEGVHITARSNIKTHRSHLPAGIN